MMSRAVWFAALVVCLPGTAALLSGCGALEEGTGTELGTMHSYAAGDTWTYRVSGTYVPASGPSQTVASATATLSYDPSVTSTDSSTVQGLTLSVPLTYGSTETTRVFTIGLTQAADGTLTLAGLNVDGAVSGVDALDSSITGPDADALDSTASWSGSGDCATLGAFTILAVKQGTDTVSTSEGIYECYEVTGSTLLGTAQGTFTAWLNPRLGTFARLEASSESDAGTLNLTYVLSGTTVEMED